jgi:hypothetical protein
MMVYAYYRIIGAFLQGLLYSPRPIGRIKEALIFTVFILEHWIYSNGVNKSNIPKW